MSGTGVLAPNDTRWQASSAKKLSAMSSPNVWDSDGVVVSSTLGRRINS